MGPGKITEEGNLEDMVTFGNYNDYVTTGEAPSYRRGLVTHSYDALGNRTDQNSMSYSYVSSHSNMLPRMDQMIDNGDGTYTYSGPFGTKMYQRNGNLLTCSISIVGAGNQRLEEQLEIEEVGGSEYVASHKISLYNYINGKDCLLSSEETYVDRRSGYNVNTGNGRSRGGFHFVEGSSYACAFMDFSGMGTDYSKKDLVGLGFTSKCSHGCQCYYSIEFVDGLSSKTGTTTNGMDYNLKEGSSLLIQLDISSITDDIAGAQKLVAGIVDAADQANFVRGPFDGHREEYAYKKSEGYILYMYENGRQDAQGSDSTWEPAARTEHGEKTSLDYTTNKGTVRYIEDPDLHIQASARGHEAIIIKRPAMSNVDLGIEGIKVTDFESAGRAISKVNEALEYVNSQRSYLGAMQNRLEHAQSIDDNISENTSASESRLRDTDMAKEMVTFSKHSILEQAGQAMLAQANQSTQGALSLIQ